MTGTLLSDPIAGALPRVPAEPPGICEVTCPDDSWVGSDVATPTETSIAGELGAVLKTGFVVATTGAVVPANSADMATVAALGFESSCGAIEEAEGGFSTIEIGVFAA